MSLENDSDNPTKPSQTPSWVLLGFVFGVLTMWFFESGQEESEPTESVIAEVPVERPRPPPEPPADNPLSQGGKPSIEIVQDLFAGLREWAFWTDDRTEIAVWNSATLSFSDHFEIIRLPDADYFRAIPAFSRLPIPGYGPENSPILFTETAEQRAKRYIQANPDKAPPPPAKPSPVEFNTVPRPPGGE